VLDDLNSDTDVRRKYLSKNGIQFCTKEFRTRNRHLFGILQLRCVDECVSFCTNAHAYHIVDKFIVPDFFVFWFLVCVTVFRSPKSNILLQENNRRKKDVCMEY
jgi:hypothetical protein